MQQQQQQQWRIQRQQEEEPAEAARGTAREGEEGGQSNDCHINLWAASAKSLGALEAVTERAAKRRVLQPAGKPRWSGVGVGNRGDRGLSRRGAVLQEQRTRCSIRNERTKEEPGKGAKRVCKSQAHECVCLFAACCTLQVAVGVFVCSSGPAAASSWLNLAQAAFSSSLKRALVPESLRLPKIVLDFVHQFTLLLFSLHFGCAPFSSCKCCSWFGCGRYRKVPVRSLVLISDWISLSVFNTSFPNAQ